MPFYPHQSEWVRPRTAYLAPCVRCWLEACWRRHNEAVGKLQEIRRGGGYAEATVPESGHGGDDTTSLGLLGVPDKDPTDMKINSESGVTLISVPRL